jgi:hypothetical protein
MRRNHLGSVGAALLFVSLVASQVVARPPKNKQGSNAASSASASASAVPAASGGAPAGSASAPLPAGPVPLAQALTGDAKAEYESGRILYGDGDFPGAFVKFKRAYELSKDGRLLWNMAVCEKNQRHYAKVLQLVTRYRFEAAAVLTDQDRQEADDLANAVKGFVSAVRIRVDQPNSLVSIDDEKVGESPLMEPVFLDMGARRLKVNKAGFLEYSQTLQVPGTTEMSVAVKLAPEIHEGRLAVTADPGQTVWLDGKAVGVGHWEGAVRSGGHSLRVTERGKKPYQTEILLRDEETRQLRITLESEAPPAAPASKNTWMWIAGGVAAGAVLAVGGYFLFRPKDETATLPASGTMQPGTVQLPIYGFGR